MGKKILVGIAVIVAIAGAVVYGILRLIDSRVERQIASTFEVLRMHLATATHGPIAIDRWSRTATINDVTLQSKGPASSPVKISRLMLAGANLSASDEFSARKVELANTSLVTAKGGVTIGLLTLENVILPQSRLHLPELIMMAMAQGTAARASPRVALEKTAAFIEQLQFDRLEMRSITFDTPPEKVGLAAFRTGRLAKGILAELAFEGVDFSSRTEDFKAGALVLKGFNLAGVLRKSAEWSALPKSPQGNEVLEMLRFLQSFEMRDFVPPKGKGKGPPVEIKLLQGTWGQFVGSVPTKGRFTLRATMPTDVNEPAFLRDLGKMGFPVLTISYDLGSDWSDKTQIMEVKPFVVEVEKLFSFSGSYTLTNVTPQIFEVDAMKFDPKRFETLAGMMEAGRLDMAFRDDGAVTFGIAEFAKAQGVTPAVAQKMMIELLNKDVASKLQTSPEALLIIGAVQRLIEQPGGTLTIALTPKGRVTVNQIIEQMKIDPNQVLSRFNVEANVRR